MHSSDDRYHRKSFFVGVRVHGRQPPGKRLEDSDVRVVARTVFEALAVLHENGFVHTGQYGS